MKEPIILDCPGHIEDLQNTLLIEYSRFLDFHQIHSTDGTNSILNHAGLTFTIERPEIAHDVNLINQPKRSKHAKARQLRFEAKKNRK
jgi:putative NADPH-quinone reductase